MLHLGSTPRAGTTLWLLLLLLTMSSKARLWALQIGPTNLVVSHQSVTQDWRNSPRSVPLVLSLTLYLVHNIYGPLDLARLSGNTWRTSAKWNVCPVTDTKFELVSSISVYQCICVFVYLSVTLKVFPPRVIGCWYSNTMSLFSCSLLLWEHWGAIEHAGTRLAGF